MITLSKLSKLACVSVSTASKAFSGSREVNEETRVKIFSVAKEHGVFKKFYNVKYPKLVIAVVIPEFQSGNYAPLLAEIQSALLQKGCSMTVTASGFMPDENTRIYDYYSKYTDVDGIIVVGTYDRSDEELNIPCVIVDGKDEAEDLSLGVTVNAERALFDALTYLKSRGAETVGFISEEKTHSKLKKFTDAMTRVYGKADERYIAVSKKRFEEGGYEGMKMLIEADRVPRALICGYDNMAFGAIRCLRDHGYSVPYDVAVIGFDDNTESKYLAPSLSSIDIKRKECAVAAVETITKMILSQPYEAPIIIEAEFKPRESSAI